MSALKQAAKLLDELGSATKVRKGESVLENQPITPSAMVPGESQAIDEIMGRTPAPATGGISDLETQAIDEIMGRTDKDELDQILEALNAEEVEEINIGLPEIEPEMQKVLDDAADIDAQMEVEEITIGLPGPVSDTDFMREGEQFVKDTFEPIGGLVTEDEMAEALGKEWSAKIMMLHDGGYGQANLNDAIDAIIKKQNGHDLTAQEQQDFDNITDAFELFEVNDPVPAHLTPFTIQNHKEIISVYNQNVPDDYMMKELIGDYHPGIIAGLNPEQIEAMTVMAHIRGSNHVAIKDSVILRNYGPKDPDNGLSDNPHHARYPTREEAEAMSYMDVAAVNFYTKNGDEPMNAALRADKVEPGSQLEAAINATESALSKLPSWNPEDGVLYRRMNGENVINLYSNLEIGQEWTEKAFTSATREPLVDLSNDLKPTFSGKVDDIYMVIQPKENGLSHGIEGVSQFGLSETEVLYQKRAKFRLIDVEGVPPTVDKVDRVTRDGYVVLFVEEI